MKKQYSLDFSIVRDEARVAAVQEILDKLETDPNQTDLEQMANYILYGKDENGHNSIQRNETYEQSKRYNSYKTSDDKVISLDELLENPLMDQQQLKPAHQRDCYTKPKQQIQRPKYDKKTGELIDIGDGDIPGMQQLWDSIDRLDRWIRQLKGEIPPDEDTLLFDDSYRLYRLKHTLIDMRRHQYYLKDAYKPTLHFAAIDHPKAQFYDWSGDSFYWISREQWEQKVRNAYTSRVSKHLEDYETRGEGDNLQVKWVVCEHNFDWENPKHVRAFMTYYSALYEQLKTKLDTYGRVLLWDFDRYRELCEFTPIRNFLIDCKIARMSYQEMVEEVHQRYGVLYNENHLASIITREIPNRIATCAKKQRILVETPKENMRECTSCGKLLPLDTLFFSRNSARKDGFSTHCKICEKLKRVKGGNKHDQRSKDQALFKV